MTYKQYLESGYLLYGYMDVVAGQVFTHPGASFLLRRCLPSVVITRSMR